LVVYTSRWGARTGTNGAGTEVVVEWLEGALTPGRDVLGTVSEVVPGGGDSPIPAGGLVLSGHGAAAAFLQTLGVGDGVRVRVELLGEDGRSWNDVWQAVGGGPRLLKGGQVVVGPGAEGFRPDVLNGTAPRSAVAVTAKGELLLVAVDGRQAASAGMTLTQLAEFLRSLGAVDAINLDGGGSTTLALRQVVVNSPSDGTQRLVANALLLFSDVPVSGEEEELEVLPALPPGGTSVVPADGAPFSAPLSLQAGTRQRFRVVRRGADGALSDLPLDAVTWGLEGRLGQLSQDGVLRALTAGEGAVCASTGRRVARFPVVVTPGPPARLTNAVEVMGDGRAWVRARVVDAYGNNVPGVPVQLRYTTAQGEDGVEGTTDAAGQTRLLLPLNQLAAGAPLFVSTPGHAPVAVRLPAPAPKVPGTPAPAAPAGEVPTGGSG
jgi:hypothetical protein